MLELSSSLVICCGPSMQYKTFWLRLWSAIVDGLVFLPIAFLNNFLSDPQRDSGVLVVWAIISYSAYWLYSVLLHARYGQTLGKMATRIKVLDRSGGHIPTLKQALIRDSGYIIVNTLFLIWFIYLVVTGRYTDSSQLLNGPAILLIYASLGWSLLEIITMATNKKRRAFHDYIAGTVVVKC
jgi:uncharacterized RDD family membrane protein YckC